jgi:hypothetical protein
MKLGGIECELDGKRARRSYCKILSNSGSGFSSFKQEIVHLVAVQNARQSEAQAGGGSSSLAVIFESELLRLT